MHFDAKTPFRRSGWTVGPVFSKMTAMRFHEKLQMCCARKGWTQTDLMRAAGDISKSTMSNYWNGETRPDMDTALRISRALGVSLDFLADDKMDSQPGGGIASDPAILRVMEVLGADESLRRLVRGTEKNVLPKHLAFVSKFVASRKEALEESYEKLIQDEDDKMAANEPQATRVVEDHILSGIRREAKKRLLMQGYSDKQFEEMVDVILATQWEDIQEDTWQYYVKAYHARIPVEQHREFERRAAESEKLFPDRKSIQKLFDKPSTDPKVKAPPKG